MPTPPSTSAAAEAGILIPEILEAALPSNVFIIDPLTFAHTCKCTHVGIHNLKNGK